MHLFVIDQDQIFSQALRSAVETHFENIKVAGFPDSVSAFSSSGKISTSEASESPAAMVVSWESLGENQVQRLREMSRNMRERAELTKPPLLLVTALEGAEIPLNDLLASGVDDVLFKPFDESLYLQKIYVLLPEAILKGAGEFLSTTNTLATLELAGEYSLCALSEYGVEVQSRAPIQRMRKFRMHSALFGAGESSIFYGICTSCRPERDGGVWKSEISFFGLTSLQLANVRSWVSQGEKLEAPLNVKLEADFDSVPQKRRILMVDLDHETESAVGQFLERHLEGCELTVYGSFSRLMSSLESSKMVEGEDSRSLASWESTAALGKSQKVVSFFDPETLDWAGFEGAEVGENGVQTTAEYFCGYMRSELISRERSWWSLIFESERAVLREFLQFTLSGQVGSIVCRFVNASGSGHLISVSATLELTQSGKPMIRAEMVDVTLDAIQSQRPLSDFGAPISNLKEIAAVILDSSFIREDSEMQVARLHSALTAATGREVPVFLTEAHAKGDLNLSHPHIEVRDVFFKPLDRSYFASKVRRAIESDVSAKQETIRVLAKGWLDIAKPIRIDSIGHYGVEFTHESPVQEGATGRFHHPELDDESGRGILGRCVRLRQTDGKRYKMLFVFVGIDRSHLLNVQRFIRRRTAHGV